MCNGDKFTLCQNFALKEGGLNSEEGITASEYGICMCSFNQCNERGIVITGNR